MKKVASIKSQRSGRKRERKKNKKKTIRVGNGEKQGQKTKDKNTKRKEREGWAEMRLIMGKVRCDNDGGSD